MPRRNLIPLALLAVLGIGTLGFAVLGASSAPSGATLTVQNASVRTFGTPTGSTSFAMDLVNSLSAAGAKGTVSQVRQVAYKPPSRMTISQVVGSNSKHIAVLPASAAVCNVVTFAAIVGGSTPWTARGAAFVRTEALATYEARVPTATPTTCEPQSTTVQGTVQERAAVRSGYLVGVRLTVVVPPQMLPGGQHATSGSESQALVLLEINGTRTAALGS